MDSTNTQTTRYTKDIFVPTSEEILAALAPEALTDLMGLGFWKVTEWHPLWNRYWRSIVTVIEGEEAAKGRHVKAVEFVGMRMAQNEEYPPWAGDAGLMLAIGVRVHVEEPIKGIDNAPTVV